MFGSVLLFFSCFSNKLYSDSEEDSNDSYKGIYTVTNGNIGNTATAYELRLK